ncbi:MAG: hypothetical protein ACYCXF_02855 [Thermoleophilia bacterium]
MDYPVKYSSVRRLVGALIIVAVMAATPAASAMGAADSLTVTVTVEARDYLSVTMTGAPDATGQLIRTGSAESGTITWVVLDN